MTEQKHTKGPWRGSSTTWESFDEMAADQRRLLAAAPGRLTTLEIVATDPKDPTNDVVVAYLGNGPTAVENGPILLASLDMRAALEEIAVLDLPNCDNPLEAAQRIAKRVLADLAESQRRTRTACA